MVTEHLPSYEQLLFVGLRGYESCTRCLATASLEHTYFLRYFGPLGRMSHFSLLILFLILIQSGKRGKWNYSIHGKIVMPEHTYTHTYIHSLLFIKHYAMKTYGGVEFNSKHFSYCTWWMWLVSFLLRQLYSRGKNLWCPLYKRLGGPHSQSGCCGEEIYLSPAGKRTWGCSAP
jgi:hypothetical protein